MSIPQRCIPYRRNRNEVPRGILFLYNETRRRDVRLRLWFGIVGRRRTGKSTLATRFNEMHRGVLENNEIRGGDSHRFTIDLRTRPLLNRTGYVDVGIFIGRVASWPPGLEPHQISRIKAFIFLFDVNENRTLNTVCLMIDTYRMEAGENMHPSILVGNKIDIRDNESDLWTADGLSSEAVSTLYGESLARSLGTVEYYECSALENIAVGPILDNILQIIMR